MIGSMLSACNLKLFVIIIILSSIGIYTTLISLQVLKPLEAKYEKQSSFKGYTGKLSNVVKPQAVKDEAKDNIASGIELLPGYESQKPEHLLSHNSTIREGEDMFVRLAEELHVKCSYITRMGAIKDGGWDICVSSPYTPEKNCIVYSFGINYDFSFDLAMSKQYGCHVKAYDPSMGAQEYSRLEHGSGKNISDKIKFYKIGLGSQNMVLPTNGWVIRTLGALLKENNHTNEIISVLKIDIEFGEWSSLLQMFEEGSLINVKQLVLEVHSMETFQSIFSKPKVDHYIEMCNILADLEVLGFRKFRSHLNPYCMKIHSRNTARYIRTCYELSYLNSNFLKQV